LPLALASAVRSFERRAAPEPVKTPVRPLCVLGLSLAFCPASPSPEAAARGASLGLLLPTALAGLDRPVFAANSSSEPAPRRPQGLVTLSATLPIQTGPAVFQTGSAPGIRPTELSPPATSPAAFPRPAHPTYRSCPTCCRRRLERQPAAGPAVSGSSLPASLAFDRVFSAIGDAGCSLELALPGLAHADLAGLSPCAPLTRFARKNRLGPDPADASAYLSVNAGCRRSSSGRCTGDTTLIGFLHRYDPDHSG